MLQEMSRRDGLSIRQLYQHVLPARGHVLIKGDPAQVADVMEEWYRDKACDGFNIVAPYLPGGLEGIVDLLVPELQRRGLFRTEYEGTTLRDSLGLPRPVKDRKSVVEGKSVSVRVDLGGRRNIKKK